MQDYIYNIGSYFSKISKNNSNRIALKYPGGKIVFYSELENLSNRIANYFLDLGLKKGDVIGVFNNKSTAGYASILAALKIGVIYTNLDFNSPFQRIKKIIERCNPKFLFYDIDCKLINETSELNINTIYFFDDFESKIEHYGSDIPGSIPVITGSDAAYIMFTSGSTGFPKGAVITHASLINFIHWGQNTYAINQEDICTNANPIYFDNSVFDFYVTLFSGAQLVPLTHEITHDPFKLVSTVAELECTSWFSVPSLLNYLLTTKALAAKSLPGIKRFIFGGEGFPKSRLKKLFEMYHGQAKLYNVYGPTECTCICSSYEVTLNDFYDMNILTPLGYLAPNFDYVILNPDNSGRLGELGLKGPNVGAGYYNDPERTQKSFIQNPYNTVYNELIYCTGDLIWVDENGHLHFKGRSDNQVKHMGYRIELEEIESAMNTLNYINETSVIYDLINENLGQIVAFTSCNIPILESEIIADTRKLLPDYMIPRKIVIFEQLPKNQNGKIDRAELKKILKSNG